jgi:transcriptional regulator with GAF, ATPase, and Fis domain
LHSYGRTGKVSRVSLPDDDESPFAADRDPSMLAVSGMRPWKILIVDDEQEVHDVTLLALRSVSFCDRALAFFSAKSAKEARALLEENPDVALVLLDVVMETDDAGLTLVRYIRESLQNQQVRVVLRTGQPGQAPESTVIRNYDISDYRTKTELTSTRLYTTVIAALRMFQQLQEVTEQREELARLYEAQKKDLEEISRLKAGLERERDYLREEVSEVRGGGTEGVLGSSPRFLEMIRAVEAVAQTDATVLVLGESGVGKELVARQVHARSKRAGGPLVKVNCASVPRELFESEFFGHVRGSFTGAHKDRVGRFQLADGGTLFLDEVGEIPVELQSKLLRALQEREVERVGDTKAQKVDVRLVAATNRDLKACVEAGTFRADLFYRLSVFPVAIPPLRERREDVIALFEHFLSRALHKLGRRFLPLGPEQVQALEAYPWPGNVRELENVAERAAILSADGVLRLDAVLPEAVAAAEEALAPPSRAVVGAADRDPWSARPVRGFYTAEELRDVERQNLVAVLEKTGGRVAGAGGAAELLGVKPSTLAYQLKTFGLR